MQSPTMNHQERQDALVAALQTWITRIESGEVRITDVYIDARNDIEEKPGFSSDIHVEHGPPEPATGSFCISWGWEDPVKCLN